MKSIDIIINGGFVTAHIHGNTYNRHNLSKEESEKLLELCVEYKKNGKGLDDILKTLRTGEENFKEIEKLNKEIQSLEQVISSSGKTITFKQAAELYPEFLIYKEEKLFLRGFETVPMPINLSKKIILCYDKGEPVKYLINFWKLCLLNPDPVARQGAFKYVTNQNLIVTPNGYIVCFRRADTFQKSDSNEKLDALFNFLSSTRIHLLKQKKELSQFFVDKIGEKYKATTKQSTDTVGTFLGLWENVMIFKSPVFTDNRTKTMRFKVGDVVSLPRNECDNNPNVECSYGLHVGTPSYVLGSTGKTLGDTLFMVLVNPANIVSVPYSDAYKMRVCEYYISSILNTKEMEYLQNVDIATFEEDYCNFEMEEVEKKLKEKIFEKEELFDEETKNSKQRLVKLLEDKKTLVKKTEVVNHGLAISTEEYKQIILDRIKR